MTPSLDWNGSEKIATVVMGPRSTTHCSDSSRVHEASLEGSFRYIWCCVFTELRVLSLSVEEGRSTFGFMAGIWAKF